MTGFYLSLAALPFALWALVAFTPDTARRPQDPYKRWAKLFLWAALVIFVGLGSGGVLP